MVSVGHASCCHQQSRVVIRKRFISQFEEYSTAVSVGQ